ncbi:MAG: hypothetical protein L0H70_02560 [Xanthomonadales bacterium]|nr:hypothetical protein [Xanthomonadales bacterium]
MNRWIAVAVWVVGSTVFAAANAHAQNLVPNPNFDSDTSQWSAITTNQGTSTAMSWDGTHGYPNTGALRIQASVNGYGAKADSACIVIDPNKHYALSADVYNNGLEGTGTVQLKTFDTTDCSDNGLATTQSFASYGPVAQGSPWNEFVFNSTILNVMISATSGALAVRIKLLVGPRSGTPQVAATFDHIVFKVAGTTPVSLQSFHVQ